MEIKYYATVSVKVFLKFSLKIPVTVFVTHHTCADVDDLVKDVGFKPRTPIETGISNFVDWYRNFYNV